MDGSNKDDERLIQRVRKIDPDRFITLCRMHLSFLLDLTSDDLDTITDYKIKSKPKVSFTASLQRKVRSKYCNFAKWLTAITMT